ncbi:MAG TPA: hypothetical protein VII98_13850 [Solirubrobacteraceae bacterium]
MSVLSVRRVGVCVGVMAALGLAAVLPAAGSAATVARPGAATGVGEYGGTIVFSSFDHGEGRWYLSIRKAGAKSAQRLAVAPSATSFRADIGTDSAGRPELIYQRCALTTRTVMVGTMPITTSERTGCELFVYSLADASGERPVRNANDPSRNDVGATLWKGRIAWTREYGSGNAPNDIVYTKTLTAPRSQPSKRLPGVPQTRCGDVDKVCGPTTNRTVGALELSGDNLAVVVYYDCTGCSGIAQSELRLDKVADASSRGVAFLVVGMNGQQFVGPSFFDGRLAWYRACAVTEASCKRAVGPWRYKLSARSYERGAPGPIRVSGFADTGSRLYEVLGCNDAEAGAKYNTSCRIDEIAPPSYSAAPAPTR